MKVRTYVMNGLALMALALGLTSVRANAQTVVRGTFELPAAAYFGNAVLQPGHYTIRFLHDRAGASFVHLTGEGAEVTLPGATRPGGKAGQSYLDIDEIGGSYFIRAFNSGAIGASLVFGVNKKVESEARRASARRGITVPVSAALSF